MNTSSPPIDPAAKAYEGSLLFAIGCCASLVAIVATGKAKIPGVEAVIGGVLGVYLSVGLFIAANWIGVALGANARRVLRRVLIDCEMNSDRIFDSLVASPSCNRMLIYRWVLPVVGILMWPWVIFLLNRVGVWLPVAAFLAFCMCTPSFVSFNRAALRPSWWTRRSIPLPLRLWLRWREPNSVTASVVGFETLSWCLRRSYVMSGILHAFDAIDEFAPILESVMATGPIGGEAALFGILERHAMMVFTKRQPSR